MAIFEWNDCRTIEELQCWDMSDPRNAPFIKIGRLLVAVDQTGAEAWQPLVLDLKKKYGAIRFVIYSGRHGALEGCFDDAGFVHCLSIDRSFLWDDQREAKRFSNLANVYIEVIDSSCFPKLIYKQRVLTDLCAGDWVIVAWCHSIASMCNMPAVTQMDYSQGSPLWKAAIGMSKQRICDIVARDFYWVPKFDC